MGHSPGKKKSGTQNASIGEEKRGPSGKTDIKQLLRSPIIHIFLIALLGFIAYSNTFHNSFHWDGSPQIAHNPVIKNLGNFISNAKGYDFNPRRVVGFFTFALNYYFGGTSVIGYHIVNLAIHVVNGLLVYLLVILTFRTPYFNNQSEAVPSDDSKFKIQDTTLKIQNSKFLIALFSALLFVVHPIQTEAVTYIVQRLASLAAMFYLLSIVLYIKGRLGQESPQADKRQSARDGTPSSSHLKVKGDSTPSSSSLKIRHNPPFSPLKLRGDRGGLWPIVWYVLALLSAIFAMKTKEIAFTLPIMIVLYEFTFFRSSPRKKLLFLLPILLTLTIIPVSVLHSGKPLGELLSDVTRQTRVQTNMPRWDYLMTEMSVVATYIRLLFLPFNQNLDYDYPVHHSLFTPAVFFPFLFLMAIVGLAGYLFYKSKGHNAPSDSKIKIQDSRFKYYRLIFFGILWFFVALSVESSFIPIVDVIFEHRVYLPSAGFFISITTGAFIVAHRLGKEKTLITFLVLILLLFSGITYARNAVWKNETSIWTDVVNKSPGKARPHNNLAYLYLEGGQLKEARKELAAALRIKPDYVEAHTCLGNVYFMQGLKTDALREYQIALKTDPNYKEAHIDLGNLYSSDGRMNEAIREYRKVMNIDPTYVAAYNSLGNVYQVQGRTSDAFSEYRTALKLSPDDFNAHNNLGNLYLKEGLPDKAIMEYQAALRLNPDIGPAQKGFMSVYPKQGRPGESAASLDFSRLYPDSGVALNNLGNAYYKQGLLNQALVQYQAALKLLPDSAEVYNNIGKIYGRQGHLDDAFKEFQTAVALDPDFADAHNMLGNVYGLQGHFDKAIKEYETASRLDPGSADVHNNLGTIYFRQGRLDMAKKEFQTALKLKPDDPVAGRNLQVLYKKKGMKE